MDTQLRDTAKGAPSIAGAAADLAAPRRGLPYAGKDETVVHAPDPLIVGSTAHVIGANTHMLGWSLQPAQRRHGRG